MESSFLLIVRENSFSSLILPEDSFSSSYSMRRIILVNKFATLVAGLLARTPSHTRLQLSMYKEFTTHKKNLTKRGCKRTLKSDEKKFWTSQQEFLLHP